MRNPFTIIVLIASVNRLSHQPSEGVNNCQRIGRNGLRWFELHNPSSDLPRPLKIFGWVLIFLPLHFSHVRTSFLDSRSRNFRTLAVNINGRTVCNQQFISCKNLIHWAVPNHRLCSSAGLLKHIYVVEALFLLNRMFFWILNPVNVHFFDNMNK